MSNVSRSTTLVSLVKCIDDSTLALLAFAGVSTFGDLAQKTTAELMTITNKEMKFDLLNITDLAMALENLEFFKTKKGYLQNDRILLYLDDLISQIRCEFDG